MIKVSVVIVTARPGYIDTITDSLSNQTLSQDEWELILVDDFAKERGKAVMEYIDGRIKNFIHIPPREVKPYSAPVMALNTGIVHCRGELVYFMNDYCYPTPGCLARHWEIYSKYGPKVIISGRLIDDIVASGDSFWRGATPRLVEVSHGNEKRSYVDATPFIRVPLKDNFGDLTPDNFISVFKEQFIPPPLPPDDLADWRLGHICGKFIDIGIYENTSIHPWSWWWCGRNDSAPLEVLLDVNGLNEAFDGTHGGADGEVAHRMMQIGCRYLVDTTAPCYELIHPIKTKSIISEQERDMRVMAGINRLRNLRKERRRIFKRRGMV